jgi:hypothetical protein
MLMQRFLDVQEKNALSQHIHRLDNEALRDYLAAGTTAIAQSRAVAKLGS